MSDPVAYHLAHMNYNPPTKLIEFYVIHRQCMRNWRYSRNNYWTVCDLCPELCNVAIQYKYNLLAQKSTVGRLHALWSGVSMTVLLTIFYTVFPLQYFWRCAYRHPHTMHQSWWKFDLHSTVMLICMWPRMPWMSLMSLWVQLSIVMCSIYVCTQSIKCKSWVVLLLYAWDNNNYYSYRQLR